MGVVHTLHHPFAVRKIADKLARKLFAVLFNDYIGAFALACLIFGGVVDIAEGVTGDCYRLLPTCHVRGYATREYWRTENRTVEQAADSAVRTFPLFGKIVLPHALRVWGYRGAFYRYAVFFCGESRLHGYFVTRLFAVYKT